MWLRRSVFWRINTQLHADVPQFKVFPSGQICQVHVFVECEATHPVVLRRLVSLTCSHWLSFLSAHKEDIIWAHSRQMSDRRAHRWWQTQKSQSLKLQSATKQAFVQSFFIFFSHMPSGWRPVWSVWPECYSSRARLPASGRPPWLQGCCWVGWAFQAYPLSPGAFTPAMRCSISCRCTQLTRSECAVKWVLDFLCKVIITLQFLFSQAELGVATQSSETGFFWISEGLKKKSRSLRNASVNVTYALICFSMRYSLKWRHQNRKVIRSHCFIWDILLLFIYHHLFPLKIL